jgi:hypothetical protein
MLKATIPRGEREAMLLAEGGDPDVVLLNGDVTLSRQRGDLSKDAAGVLSKLEHLNSWSCEEPFEGAGVLAQLGTVS